MSELEAHLPAAALDGRDLHTGLFQTSVSRQLLSTTLPDLRHQLVIHKATQQHLLGVVEELKVKLAAAVARSGELLVSETRTATLRAQAEATRDIVMHESGVMRSRHEHLADLLGVHPRDVPDSVGRLTDRVTRLEDLFQRQFDAGHIPAPLGARDDGRSWDWQSSLGLYLTGYEAPPPNAAVALLPPPVPAAPVVGPRTVLQVSPAPGSGGESRPMGLEELEGSEVMLGMFSSGLIAQLRLLASILPTALGTVVETSDFNPNNLTVLRDIVLRGATLPQGLTFQDVPRTPRSTAPASLGAPPEGFADMDTESVAVSQEREDQLLQDPPPNASGTSSDTDP
jgi:hypothetical protein